MLIVSTSIYFANQLVIRQKNPPSLKQWRAKVELAEHKLNFFEDDLLTLKPKLDLFNLLKKKETKQ
jgi:hypothetical protein